MLVSIASKENKNIPNYIKFLISGVSGMTATLVVQPLDLLKVRMQLSGEGGSVRDHQTSFHAMQSVVKNEGFLGLYAGISANLVRQATYTTTRMFIFQVTLERLERYGYTGLMPQVAAGTLAGLVGVTVSTPTDVSLVRMMSDTRLPQSEQRGYKHVFDAYLKIRREEGISGLFVGFKSSVIRAIIGNISQLVTYMQAKSFLIDKGYMEDGTKCHFTSSFLSGIVYSLTSCPFDVAKTRIQQMKGDSGLYSSVFDVMAQTVRQEGTTGLWKGLLPLYFRIAPHTILLFVFIEKLTSLYKEKVQGISPSRGK